MYQNYCKKCGSFDLFTEIKGNNTGLYCCSCGSWQQWISKEDIRAFEHNRVTKNPTTRSATPEEEKAIADHIDDISYPTGVSFFDEKTVAENLLGITNKFRELKKEFNKKYYQPQWVTGRDPKIEALKETMDTLLDLLDEAVK